MQPLFEDWANRVAEYGLENKKCVQIIQRFDEVLCQKASKISLEELETKLDEYLTIEEFNSFQGFKTKLDEEFKTNIQKINSRFDEFTSSTRQLLASAILKITKEAKDQVIQSLGGKPVEPQELHALLKLKANKEDFKKLGVFKADKAELETANYVIEILHNQINHLWLILKDFFKTQTENHNKSENLNNKNM